MNDIRDRWNCVTVAASKMMIFVKMNDKSSKSGKIDSSEILKSAPHIIVEIIEYVDNSVVTKTILKKLTGDVGLMSFDAGEGLAEKITPFDTFVQIIEGKAEIFIEGRSNILLTGQGIVIPAHRSSSIKPNGRFKMISTVIKSGYE